MKTATLYGGLLGLALGTVLVTPAAYADTFSGKLNGHDCAHEGKTCPVDRLDPHIALERDFVLQQANGEYKFLPNVPRTVKVRYVLSDIEVSGKLNPKYQAIEVSEFRVKSDGGMKTVWSKALQQEEFEYLYGEGKFPTIY
jgi:hypothetical protein